jgi:S1-C subfamily serine protease
MSSRDAAHPDSELAGNMFVPIDALKPILDELVDAGRVRKPGHPWLGVFAEELRGHLFVNRVATGGPAAAVGLARDDVILAVKGEPVQGLADFYKKVWALGDAGVEVPLTVLTAEGVVEFAITSGDRYDYLKLNPTY